MNRIRRGFLASASIVAMLGMSAIGMGAAGASLPFAADFGEQPLFPDSRFALFAEGDPPAGGGGGGGAAPTVESLQQQLDAANARLGGYADYDAIKADRDKTAGELKKITDGQKTEAERLAADLATANERAEKAEARATETTLRNAFTEAAQTAGIAHIGDAYQLLDKSKVTTDKATGEPTNMADLVKALAKDKPFLLAPSGGTGGGGNAHNPGRNRDGGGNDGKRMSMADAITDHYAK